MTRSAYGRWIAGWDRRAVLAGWLVAGVAGAQEAAPPDGDSAASAPDEAVPADAAPSPEAAPAEQAQTTVEVRTLGVVVEEQVFTLDLGTASGPPPLPGEDSDPEEEVPAPDPLDLAGPTGGADPADLGALRLAPAYDLGVKHKVHPEVPVQVEVLYANRKLRCHARVWVDKSGSAQRVSVYDCPKALHLLAATALTRWKWDRPDVTVPPSGLEVDATVSFERDAHPHDARMYHPGVTWLRDPEHVTADPRAPALVRSGRLPDYPAQVFHGDAVCTVELTVTRSGASKDLLIDDCSAPYRLETLQAVKGWRWYPAVEGGEPVESSVEFQLVFKLEQEAATAGTK